MKRFEPAFSDEGIKKWLPDADKDDVISALKEAYAHIEEQFQEIQRLEDAYIQRGTYESRLEEKIKAQEQVIEMAVSMAKDFVECSEPMSDLEYRVATKMIARDFLASLEQREE